MERYFAESVEDALSWIWEICHLAAREPSEGMTFAEADCWAGQSVLAEGIDCPKEEVEAPPKSEGVVEAKRDVEVCPKALAPNAMVQLLHKDTIDRSIDDETGRGLRCTTVSRGLLVMWPCYSADDVTPGL